ncbi:hypothetical protein H8K52_06425 [Undibacterium seohonense]|uniref:Methyltransferase domain-containing protein n=1 Tax=Undibacterium seohonense TaxID=1344950 RepID=A0ABR6X352_9BURK|nr:hypothetical protein [Undibacterium seohonense]MBC3806980.1 hypothetical protein [Undibacterium seohonense]
MEEVVQLLQTHKAWLGIENLRAKLLEAKSSLAGYPQVYSDVRSNETLMEILDKCPYIFRAKTKPRGYAGDAVMMDFIYGIYEPEFINNLDLTAEEIFRLTTNSSASKAVRHRRRLIANTIDSVCQHKQANILSVACGHLREAEISTAVQSRTIGKYFALDQDIESLKVVESDYGHLGITPIQCNVAKIIAGKVPNEIQGIDFIYSAGLYDYLNDDVAVKLTTNLAKLLNKNGQILLANFIPHHQDVGFMECVMDWDLIYRTPENLKSILSKSGLSLVSCHIDPTESIVYVIGKKSE